MKVPQIYHSKSDNSNQYFEILMELSYLNNFYNVFS